MSDLLLENYKKQRLEVLLYVFCSILLFYLCPN